MEKECAGLFIALSLCNFGLSHVGDQTTKTSPPAPNFVYSVIINQSPDVTVFWAQADKKKKMWRNYSGKRTGGKRKRVAAEEELTEIERKVDLEHTHTHSHLYGSLSVSCCV